MFPKCFDYINHKISLQWSRNGRDGVSDHQPHDCLPNRLFGHRSKKTSMLGITGLCAGYSPVTGEFAAQTASNAENVSIWWRHHVNEKPEMYGMAGNWIDWKIENKLYVFNRSVPKYTVGSPMGSVLGPLRFLLLTMFLNFLREGVFWICILAIIYPLLQ